MMKMFERKVNMFLENYRAEMCHQKEKNWREKVTITEKAVTRNKNELRDANHSRKDEILAPTVKEMFDELKEELESLKKFNKKLVDSKNENIVEIESKVMKVKGEDSETREENKIYETF